MARAGGSDKQAITLTEISMTNIHQQTFGTGKPLAMVHGWAMHGGIWRGFAQGLADRRQVTCLDLPGHGRSRKISPFTLATAADALANGYQENNGWWLGWSLGASVVLELARRYPERVEGLILLAGNPRFSEEDDWPGMKPRLLQQFADHLTADCRATLTRFLALQVNGLADGKSQLKTLKAAIAECEPPDNETLHGGLRILKQADLRPVLMNLTVPVLVVSGSHDTLVPSAVVPRIGELSSHVETQVIARAGHVPFLSHSRELQAIIADFMDSHGGEPRQNLIEF